MIKITLRELLKCTEEQIKLVREIRNQESVRKSMYTDHHICLDEHLKWVGSLKNDKQTIVFVVFVDDFVSGVVSLTAIDRFHLKSDWAFYLDEAVRGGLGAVLEYRFLDFVFRDLELEKLNCEVIETNEGVRKLHGKFGFVEEGFRREQVIKNQQRVGVHFLGLTRSDWNIERQSIYKRYLKVMNKFDLEIEYDSGLN